MVPSIHRTFGIFVLLVFAFNSSSCSRLVSQNIDWLVANKIDNYFELTTEQKLWLRQQIIILVDDTGNLRQQAKSNLQSLSDDIGNGLTLQQWQHHRQLWETLQRPILEKIIPIGSALLANLSQSQREFAIVQYDKKRSEPEANTPQQIQRERIEDMIGGLSDEQQKILLTYWQQHGSDIHHDRQIMHNYYKQRRQLVIDFIKKPHSVQQYQAFFWSYYQSSQTPPVVIADTKQRTTDRQDQLLATFLPTLSQKQRKKAQQKLAKWIDYLDTIEEHPPTMLKKLRRATLVNEQ